MAGGMGALAFSWSPGVLSAPPAIATPAAAPAQGPCARAYQRALEHRKNAQLQQAREEFVVCAKTSCGEVLSLQCRGAVQQLDTDIPSVIPVVSDPSGEPIVEVSVSIDGQLMTSRLDGRAIIVNPGVHEFSFSTARGVFHTDKLLIVEGQRNRLLSVHSNEALLPAASAPAGAAGSSVPEATPVMPAAAKTSIAATPAQTSLSAAADPGAALTESGLPVLPIVVGGVGVAAIGSAFLLAHWGSEDNARLDGCKPNCNTESVDHVRDLYLAADITLGVGVVALGSAAWLFFSDQNDESPATAQAYEVTVKRMKSGAFAAIKGAF